MRTTVALDEELVAKARSLTGLKEKSALVREGLKALIERESALRRSAAVDARHASGRRGGSARLRRIG